MNSVGAKKRGRPQKSFDQLSLVSKRRKISEITSQLSFQEIGFAAEKTFRANGFLNASRLINIIMESPEIASDYLDSYVKVNKVKTYTADEALALMVDLRLSKLRYQFMYEGSKSKNYKLYPAYNQVLVAKKRCYPLSETYEITETGFTIELQSILDLTANRLIQTLPMLQSNKKLRMVSKWGFDGASGQSRYKQIFQNSDSDDGSVFITTTVPIVLDCGNESGISYWKNDKPSSTTLCRPIRLEFVRESDEYTLKIKKEMDQQIQNLRPTIIVNESNCVEIEHELVCSMIDGKIVNAVTETNSSQTCSICNATPKQMNNLDLISKRQKNTDNYKYGLSTLHAWIRFLECVLHISYNLSFKKWSTRNAAHKVLRAERKAEIQKEFRARTGLLIDVVKQGFGTTNDGNTAKRFFRNYEVSAEITGFDVNLLKRFAVILQTIACGGKINVFSFAIYARTTAEMYVKLYPWYYMPVSVHKILVHSSEIIDFAVVPIGQLSEEVQEARHKEVRRYREHHTRKVSRLKTVEDLCHILLVSSDPLIKTMRKTYSSKESVLFPEANELLQNRNLELQIMSDSFYC